MFQANLRFLKLLLHKHVFEVPVFLGEGSGVNPTSQHDIMT